MFKHNAIKYVQHIKSCPLKLLFSPIGTVAYFRYCRKSNTEVISKQGLHIVFPEQGFF